MEKSNIIPLLRNHQQSAAFLLLCAALMTAPAVFAQDFWKPGKYSVGFYKPWNTPLPHSWKVDVTYPKGNSGSFPLIFMFNGMECQASWYKDIVDHVASWGYVIVQYTTGFFYPLGEGEREEVEYLTPLLRWLEKEASVNGNVWWHKLAGKIDFSRKAVMGHSRGGKLASLHYANSTNNFTTAVLFDPVDCSLVAQGDKHPSAIAALAGVNAACDVIHPAPHGTSTLSAAIIGAGITGGVCNPLENNAHAFFRTLSTESLYIKVKEAGHMTFAQPPKPASQTSCSPYTIYNRMCGSCRCSKITSQEVISEARTMAVAWLESKLRPSQDTTAHLARYKEHLMTLTVKGVETVHWPFEGVSAGSLLGADVEVSAGAAAVV
ncbi:hypothetical protein Vafri_13981 [Volvox africanus]|uniref:Chlorophyllase n=1 Tax=Volvox africanus TaxID=51714 RepID=A0A8J4F3U8_9CHLO|nr:hypothetical protein Vafri_13981 [Volvox africanus]GIL58983.1 hypothetical protein Vafri_13981 [Volvox africanus]